MNNIQNQNAEDLFEEVDLFETALIQGGCCGM